MGRVVSKIGNQKAFSVAAVKVPVSYNLTRSLTSFGTVCASVWRLLGACPSSGWELVCRGEIPAINRKLVNKSGDFAFAIMSDTESAFLSASQADRA
jgi:hypothetical protein